MYFTEGVNNSLTLIFINLLIRHINTHNKCSIVKVNLDVTRPNVL